MAQTGLGKGVAAAAIAAMALMLTMMWMTLPRDANAAAVIIGPDITQASNAGVSCNTCTVFQLSDPGLTTRVPFDGTLVSMSIKKTVDWGDVRARVLVPIAGLEYLVRGSSRVIDASEEAGNTFPMEIPVRAGDALGVSATTQFLTIAETGAAVAIWSDAWVGGNIADGESRPYHFTLADRDLAAQFAVIDESNEIKIVGFKRKKNGTGVLRVKVKSAGKLTVVGGKKVKKASANATGAQTLKVKIAPKGKFKKKLAKKALVKGKAAAKVNLKVSFKTPSLSERKSNKKVKLVRK